MFSKIFKYVIGAVFLAASFSGGYFFKGYKETSDISVEREEFEINFTLQNKNKSLIKNYGEEDSRRVLEVLALDFYGDLHSPDFKEIYLEWYNEYLQKKIDLANGFEPKENRSPNSNDNA